MHLETTALHYDFHREQALHRWLSATSNGMRSFKDVALGYLRRIANSKTVEDYNLRVGELRGTTFWKAESGKKIRSWIQKKWLPLHKVEHHLNMFTGQFLVVPNSKFSFADMLSFAL